MRMGCKRKITIKHGILVLCLIAIFYYFGVFTHLFEKDFYTEFSYPYNGDVHNSVEQLRRNANPEIAPINSYNYEFITNCSRKCTDGNAIQIRLAYLIKSAPENFRRRAAIRNSWGFEQRFSDVEIRRVFLLGTRINESLQADITKESGAFKDIVQANFLDTYYNNTIKTMMGFKWAVKFCVESKFYMFVDDDYYISTKNVLRFVRNPTNYPRYLNTRTAIKHKRQLLDFELPDDVRLYTGYVYISAPLRHITSKWYVTLEEYPYHLWPAYVTAGSYILSKEALLDMYYTSFYTKHFKFDDIYVGLLALKANIEPYHNDEFYFYKKSYSPKEYAFTVASHGYGDPNELQRVWNEQKSLGNA